MRLKKFLLLAVCFLVLAVILTRVKFANDRKPALSSPEKQYLIDTARKTIGLYLENGRVFKPEEVPGNLLKFNNKIHLTLRVKDNAIATRASHGENLVDSTVLAALKATVDTRTAASLNKRELDSLQLEFNIIKEEDRMQGRNLKSDRSAPVHFSGTGDGFVDLFSGNTYIPPEEVKKNRIYASIIAGGYWLMRNQNRDGSYKYWYYPDKDSYSRRNNIVRQAGTAYAMAFAGRTLGDTELTASGKRAIDFFLKHIKPVETKPDSAYVYFEKRANLGVTGLLLLAMAESADYEEYRVTAEKLANAILYLQNADGSFRTHYEPEDAAGGEDYFPGEAMLGLVRLYRLAKDERYLASLKKAFPYYSKYWRENKNTAFVPWQSSLLAELYKITKDKRYADFVFEMNDWILLKQYNQSNSPYEEYVGGYTTGNYPGSSTGSYAEGMADAYSLARSVNDAKRIEEYGRSLLNSARFLMNLQFIKEDMHHVENYSRTAGGFRQSLANNSLRNDYTQHAIIALAKILLFLNPA